MTVWADTRAEQARRHERAAAAALVSVQRHTAARDRLVRALAAEDPAWTAERLAEAVGVSAECVCSILAESVDEERDPRNPPDGLAAAG